MSKYAIVIPTYISHFKYVITLLKSYKNYVKDQNEISVNIVVSNENELHKLTELLKLLNIKNLHIHNIEKILNEYGYHVNSDDLLKNLGRFSYQTIKKLYAVHYLNFEKFLIIDSESLFCDTAKISELIDNYFKKPYVFYSDMPNDENYKNWSDYKTTNNCCNLLHAEFNNKWFLEGFHWFYDKKIVNDLFSFFENKLFDVINDFCSSQTNDFEKAIFECILYYQFIYKNNEKYNYNFINSPKELCNIIGRKIYEKTRKKMQTAKFDFLPFTIHGLEYITFKDISVWSKFYKNINSQMARCGCLDNAMKTIAIILFIKKAKLKIICSSDRIRKIYYLIKLKKLIPTFLFEKLNSKISRRITK